MINFLIENKIYTKYAHLEPRVNFESADGHIEELNFLEVEEDIQKLGNNKSSGPDDICEASKMLRNKTILQTAQHYTKNLEKRKEAIRLE